jgi:AcrR family transcriptional regulator
MNMAQRLLGHAPSSQEETRWRLLQSATEVFAEVGFKAATTREIARRAEVNLAAIHYHFGDKAALYREVFRLPFLNDCNSFATIEVESIPLRDALYALYVWLFPPEAESDPMLRQFMRLHAREEGEPSGVLGDAMVQAFRPNHDNLRALLCRELGLEAPDDDVERLAFSLVGLATVYLHGGRSAVEAFAPQLLKGVAARETMVQRLVDHALALIAGEKNRRMVSKKENT